MSQFVSQYYSWIVLTLAAAAAVSLVVMVFNYYHSRKDAFFFLREEAGKRTRYASWVFLTLLGVTVVLLLTPPQENISPAAPLPLATAQAAGSTATTGAVAIPSPTSTPLPTPTQPPSPTPVTGPLNGASLYNVTLAKNIGGDGKPLDVTDVFPAGTKRVYLFFQYRGMIRGLQWTQVWLRGTEEVFRETGPWEWGDSGTSWLYLTPDGGYTPGEYEAQLYVGDNLQQSVRFRVE